MEQLLYVNQNGEQIAFSVRSIFYTNISKDVDGLSSLESTIHSAKANSPHGSKILSTRIEARDISIKGFIYTRDKNTLLAQRMNLARILNPELSGTLTYKCNHFSKCIKACPENSPRISKKNLLSEFAIDFYCESPFWEDEVESKNEIAMWEGSFEFDSYIDDAEEMIFGYKEPSLIVNCFNYGDVKTGLVLELKALGAVNTPSIINIDTREFMQIDAQLLAGDIIRINTHYGKKSVVLIRNNETRNYFRYLNPNSTFLQLNPKDNLLRYAAIDGEDDLEIAIYHTNKYLGV